MCWGTACKRDICLISSKKPSRPQRTVAPLRETLFSATFLDVTGSNEVASIVWEAMCWGTSLQKRYMSYFGQKTFATPANPCSFGLNSFFRDLSGCYRIER